LVLAAVAAGLVVAGLGAGTPAAAQTKIKFATYVPPMHAAGKYFEDTLKDLAAKSNGTFEIVYFPGAQLGPPPKYYDMAKTGQADITWFLHGNTPGVFPLTELSTIPLLIGSAEIGAKVLNEPELRDKYLVKEHVGVHILNLHTHQPANIYTHKKQISSVDDFKGLRLRVPSGPIRDLAISLGATPDGMPPTQWAEALQKGTIDGVFTDYGGAGIAFRIGPVVGHATELYVYVGSFCTCINQKTWDGLPAEVRTMIDERFAAEVEKPGVAFDSLDDIGKKRMVSEGTKPSKLPAAEMAKFRAKAEAIAESILKKIEGQGHPAREVYALMQKLSEKHAKTSRNFWAE
jgi:TRAP-type C4-dicarboxylate transport system substrate-binding protein